MKASIILSTFFMLFCAGVWAQHSAVPVFENDSIAIYRVDSISFFSEKNKYPSPGDTVAYIRDFSQAKKMLVGVVDFDASDISYQQSPIRVHARNGKEIDLKETVYYQEAYFDRYYPSEDIVLFEAGHSSDFSINLKTGEMGAERVGNPYYIRYSPKKLFRVNGYFPGQECSSYFLQQQIGQDSYRYYAAIPIHLSDEGFDLCYIEDLFWISDREMYFRNFFYGAQSERLGFFRLKIKGI